MYLPFTPLARHETEAYIRMLKLNELNSVFILSLHKLQYAYAICNRSQDCLNKSLTHHYFIEKKNCVVLRETLNHSQRIKYNNNIVYQNMPMQSALLVLNQLSNSKISMATRYFCHPCSEIIFSYKS